MRKGLLYFILPVLFLSCHSHVTKQTENTISFDKAAFDKERAAWQSAGIVSYEFIQEYRNMVMPVSPVKSFVVNGENTGFVLTEPSSPDEHPHCYGGTIDDIFTALEKDFEADKKLIEDENSEWTGLIIKITYDGTYHYPQTVNYEKIRPGPEPLGSNGGRWKLNISDFAILEQ